MLYVFCKSFWLKTFFSNGRQKQVQKQGLKQRWPGRRPGQGWPGKRPGLGRAGKRPRLGRPGIRKRPGRPGTRPASEMDPRGV
jgi:hypothetical protein